MPPQAQRYCMLNIQCEHSARQQAAFGVRTVCDSNMLLHITLTVFSKIRYLHVQQQFTSRQALSHT